MDDRWHKNKQKDITRHHLKNRCTFPEGTENSEMNENNIVHICDDFHFYWHRLMGNLTPNQAIEFIRIVLVAGKTWSTEDLHHLRNFIADTVDE